MKVVGVRVGIHQYQHILWLHWPSYVRQLRTSPPKHGMGRFRDVAAVQVSLRWAEVELCVVLNLHHELEEKLRNLMDKLRPK